MEEDLPAFLVLTCFNFFAGGPLEESSMKRCSHVQRWRTCLDLLGERVPPGLDFGRPVAWREASLAILR